MLFRSITEAVVALRHNRIDAAVLDINLGGESVYPLADILRAENIPFIFVTGYGSEELDSRFSTVPILQKPIERQMLQGLFLSTALAPNVVHVNPGASPKARLGGRPRAIREPAGRGPEIPGGLLFERRVRRCVPHRARDAAQARHTLFGAKRSVRPRQIGRAHV